MAAIEAQVCQIKGITDDKAREGVHNAYAMMQPEAVCRLLMCDIRNVIEATELNNALLSPIIVNGVWKMFQVRTAAVLRVEEEERRLAEEREREAGEKEERIAEMEEEKQRGEERVRVEKRKRDDEAGARKRVAAKGLGQGAGYTQTLLTDMRARPPPTHNPSTHPPPLPRPLAFPPTDPPLPDPPARSTRLWMWRRLPIFFSRRCLCRLVHH
jgi:hypothetical protein